MILYKVKYSSGNLVICLCPLKLIFHEVLHVPIRYYHNITSNTLTVLEAMSAHGVPTLIYSSTCATYGEPEKMPITEETPQVGCKGRIYF